MKTSILRLSLLFACVLTIPLTHRAAPTPPFGERVLFSDAFIDNRNHWDSVAVVNQSGEAAPSKAAINTSEWGPSVANDGKGVVSTTILRPAPKLTDGPISLYMTVRTEEADGTDGSRFSIKLSEVEGGPSFISLLIRPATSNFIEYRDQHNAGKSTTIASAHSLFRSSASPRTLKLTLFPPSGQSSFATAEAFYLDPKTKEYVSLGKTEAEIHLPNSELPALSLHTRNGNENGAAWFDSVMVTQGTAARR